MKKFNVTVYFFVLLAFVYFSWNAATTPQPEPEADASSLHAASEFDKSLTRSSN